MRLRDARKLHNGDQVVIKGTDEIVTVIRAYPLTTDPERFHCVDVMTKDGFQTLSHIEFK